MILSWLPDLVTRDIDRLLHYTLLWGFEAVDLRMVENARVPHVKQEKLVRRLRETEVDVAAVVPGFFEGPVEERVGWMNDLAALPETIRFCKHVSCTTILVSSFRASESADARSAAADALRRAGDVAGKQGIRIAVSNEADGLVPSAEDLSGLLSDIGHEAVVASWSPTEALRAGGHPEDGFDELLPFIAHVRAAQVSRAGTDLNPAPFDAGELDWPHLMRRLRAGHFDGPICVEPRAEPVKKQAMRDATAMHRWWREAARAA
jgi:sugar phosphate isomerase/epimerase